MPPRHPRTGRLEAKAAFLQRFRISPSEFSASGLRWRDLEAIFADYSEWSNILPPQASSLAEMLRLCPEVHAAKSRVKKAENLIEKIIRRSIEENTPWANPRDYIDAVPDLIGLRALVLVSGAVAEG